MALGKLGTIRGENEGHVRELRKREAEGVVHERLAKRVRQVLLGAQHVGDSHGGVVHGDAKVVHGHTVGAQHHEIAERVRIPTNLTPHHVVDFDAFALRHAEAIRKRNSLVHHFLHLRLTRRGPLPHVLRRKLLLLCLSLHRFQLFIRAKARVHVSARHELLGERLVNFTSLALPVRPTRPTDVGSFVPIQPKPFQIGNHAIFARARRSRLIRILDSKHEFTTHLLRVQVIKQRRARATDV